MAPLVEPGVILIIPWPLFSAYDADGAPLIGGKLYTYAANTSTPKASFADPFLVTANSNPVILDAHGQAMVYLDGLYRLVLTTRDGEQLWEVDSYTWSSGLTPVPGGVQVGVSQVTLTAVDGAAVLTAANLVPQGYRVLGVRSTIVTAFGTSRGLTRLLIGDSTASDRWAIVATLDASTATTQQDFRAADCPISTASGYAVLVAALGGLFDGVGQLTLIAHWERLLDSAGGDPSTGLEVGTETVLVNAVDGARQLTVSALVPLGARVLGLRAAITADFGQNRGLQGILLGDDVAHDRWGRMPALTSTTTTNQGNFRSADAPIAALPYTLLVSADGGLFDASGALTLTVYWSALIPA